MIESRRRAESPAERTQGPIVILHVIIDLQTGGAELMLKRLVLFHRGNSEFRHHVISLRSMGTVGPELAAAGIDVEALQLNSSISAPLTLFRLARRIREIAPRIVQCWMYHADLIGGLAARVCGRRPAVIWGVRIADIRPEFGVSKATGLVRYACAVLSSGVPDRIVYVAREARRIHEANGYDRTKGMVIPNGFSLPAPGSKSLRHDRSIGSDRPLFVGSAGRFNRQKNHAAFIEAARQVASRFPQARFLMCGEGIDPSNEKLMRWIEDSGIPERFHLLGRQDDMDRFMNGLDVFCLHSLTEGFPNVVGEAMAASVPCVVTDAGDAALLVGDTGKVVPPEDSEALADAICALLSLSDHERAAMGRRALKRIAQSYSMPAIMTHYEGLYRELASLPERRVA